MRGREQDKSFKHVSWKYCATRRNGERDQAGVLFGTLITRHRGVNTLEQRSSVATSKVICIKPRHMTEKEGITMTKSIQTESPKSPCDFRNVFLLALHVGVLAASLWIHPVCQKPADRALPYAV